MARLIHILKHSNVLQSTYETHGTNPFCDRHVISNLESVIVRAVNEVGELVLKHILTIHISVFKYMVDEII